MNIKDMKNKILFILMLLGLLFEGCNNEELECAAVNKTKVDVIAPNGQKIAADIESLTDLVAEIVEESYGENKDVKINKITYYDVEQGFVAEVAYNTYDGYSSKVIVTNTSLHEGTNLKRIKTRREDGEDMVVTIYSCKNTNSKKCPDCEIGRSGNTIRCSCSKGDRSYCELEKREK
ncbi:MULTISPECIES: hypothetical protein [Bacteroides]|jgi:outer membrane murein-binding lipoprotein Lpp|nr:MULTISPECIES: hypothetical protein [Bacteroides]MCS3210609.1 hypothetical protein [Bacteroides thetaiotaomicron]MDC2171972.1 hypothetical protein [Bacteroides thetaiotaomicron]MDC2187352.1 hypothetical protein [Bacteroides thetaiotaomicron]